MQDKKKQQPEKKERLHPRNRHRGRYDFKALSKKCPELSQFVAVNKYGDESIDFFNPEAVKTLNKALLFKEYGITSWEIPADYLCPPIPGRADYIHHIADLLSSKNSGKVPTGKNINCLDIGVGANCIYPIIGNRVYGWTFVGTDIDETAIKSAKNIVASNSTLVGKVECRFQKYYAEIFDGAIEKNERFDLTICNPPFHNSLEEAQAGTIRKLSNLKKKKVVKPQLNFGGTGSELWTEGGEKRFILKMIKQSTEFSKSCYLFSTLVSKQANLKFIYEALKLAKVKKHKTIEMGQGNKTSRIVAWTFLNGDEEKQWIEERWNS